MTLRRSRPLTADEKDEATRRGQKEYRRGTAYSALEEIADGVESLTLLERGWQDMQQTDVDGSLFGKEKPVPIPSWIR